MALSRDLYNSGNVVSLGNREDYCVLCLREIKAKNEIEYRTKKQALIGKLEGEKVVKISLNGNNVCICLDHIHKIAKNNPLPKEKSKDIQQTENADTATKDNKVKTK